MPYKKSFVSLSIIKILEPEGSNNTTLRNGSQPCNR